MVVHYSVPKIKSTCTHSGTDYQLEGYSTITDVILEENAVARCMILAADTKGETFLNKVDVDDNIKVELQFADDPSASWKQVFGGWAFDLTPNLSIQGELVGIQARGYGLGLLAMPVGEQYGTESANPTLNTISEVLKDATHGIIPKWVMKVLKTATDSGYSINTTKVADVTSDFRYLYWSYKPALNCLADMLDLISAANTPDAGCHWIVVPDGTTAYLCVATIGAHEDPPADIWPTWWNTDQAGSTIEVKKDMLVSTFTKQRSDANYILYHGALRKPADGDMWTEKTPISTYWSTTNCTIGSSSGAGFHPVGSNSLRAEPNQGVTGYWRYPKSPADADWNFTAMGGKYNIPSVNFYIRIDSNIEVPIHVSFYTGASDYYRYDLVQELGEWDDVDKIYKLVPQSYGRFYHINLPIGPYAKQDKTHQKIWAESGSPNWGAVDAIRFCAKSKSGQTGQVNVDGLHFAGWILRGARDDTKIGTQKARVKLIVDDVGKDDSTKATDDSYVIAQLAKAELYRAVTTPIIGQIVIPMKEQILPGQLCHIHFGKKNGSFNIDTDMRFLKVRHRFAPHGARTYLTLTDDVKNSRPTQPNIGYNLILKATNPNFQNRERASQKTRDIDISQMILSKNYDT